MHCGAGLIIVRSLPAEFFVVLPPFFAHLSEGEQMAFYAGRYSFSITPAAPARVPSPHNHGPLRTKGRADILLERPSSQRAPRERRCKRSITRQFSISGDRDAVLIDLERLC